MSVVFFLCRVRSECREPGAKCRTHGKGVAEPAILCHSLVTSVSVVGLLFFLFFFPPFFLFFFFLIFQLSSKLESQRERSCALLVRNGESVTFHWELIHDWMCR